MNKTILMTIRDLLLVSLCVGALHAMPAPTRVQFGGPAGLAYNPSRVVVHAGEMVQWQGSFNIHPLISDDNLWPTQATGTSFLFTFTKPGTYRYHCGRHSVMQGTVQVVE